MSEKEKREERVKKVEKEIKEERKMECIGESVRLYTVTPPA
jgi:hypothetical protein